MAAQSSVSATPGILRSSSLRRMRHHARDLKREGGVDAGQPGAQDRRLAIDVGKIEIMIEAAPPQRVGKLARRVRGQHDAGNRGRLEGSEFRDRHLIIGKQFEQERLELLVGAVDFVDQQHRRRRPPDRGQQRPFEQIILGEDMRFSMFSALSPENSRALMAMSWR